MGDRLKDRVAIVTGAGGGIGRGEALLLAQEGASVIVNDFNEEAARSVVSEIKEAGGKAAGHFGSVADVDAAEGMVKDAIGTFGGLHILVNNAGFTRDSMIFNMSPDEWDQIMDVHLRGLFCPFRAAAIYWRQSSKDQGEKPVFGRIINTSSGTGLFGNVGQTNYAAAKAGIAAFTIVAAQELAKYGVLVNAIAPNARTVLTEATRGLADVVKKPDEGFDVWDPANVAPLVAWLASEECQVNGGVFFQIGGRVSLCTGWTVSLTVGHDAARLTLDDLDDLMPKLLEGRDANKPASQGSAMHELIIQAQQAAVS